MFTGIITDTGTITAIEEMTGGKRVTLDCGYDMSAIPLGASIACDGACMTVVQRSETRGQRSEFIIEVSPESLARTTLAEWKVGSKVNLERPVAVGGEFGGHFVTGHVDAVGTLESIKAFDEFTALAFSYPQEFGIYLAEKGSVAINGVSLTVNAVTRKDRLFNVMIIPHTLVQTNLGALKAGGKVNLEADLIARYLLAQQQKKEIV